MTEAAQHEVWRKRPQTSLGQIRNLQKPVFLLAIALLTSYPTYLSGLLQKENMKAFGKACKRTSEKKARCWDYYVSDYCGFCGRDFKKSGLGATVESGEQVRVGLGDR